MENTSKLAIIAVLAATFGMLAISAVANSALAATGGEKGPNENRGQCVKATHDVDGCKAAVEPPGQDVLRVKPVEGW